MRHFWLEMGDRSGDESITGASLSTGWRGVAVRAGLIVLRASLKVTPRLMVWVIRRQFAESGKQLAASLRAQRPANVSAVIDEHYGEHPDARLDVYIPEAAAKSDMQLPTVVWTHGGGWVGGSKDEIGDYFRMIAAAGFAVVGVEYPLAPGARYPTPVRQVMAALRHLQANADRLRVDPNRLVLAGDSAGAHITAQVAAIVTNAGYGEEVGVTSTITPDQLRAVALCCGPYDLALVNPDSPLKNFILTVAWAYSGTRGYRNNEHFMSTTTVTSHVTEAFPPTFITAGNADPLLAHSHTLASALESKGVDVETLFYPEDHQPELPHEYQFDVMLDDGSSALRRLIAFFQRYTQP
jgi:acetyl esterase